MKDGYHSDVQSGEDWEDVYSDEESDISSSISSDYYDDSDEEKHENLPEVLYPRCPLCAESAVLFPCDDCKLISYCSVLGFEGNHQEAHLPRHRDACSAIQRTREALEREEAALRTSPGGNPFETGVGRFWSILGTRDYMRARFAHAVALRRVDTKVAVEKTLAHCTDLLRLSRSDDLGVRDMVPCLLLRLGRDQECYDFIKWWATVDDKYDWSNVTLPYLDLRKTDAFEPVDQLCAGNVSLTHLVTLALLKLRLRNDIEAYLSDPEDYHNPFTKPARPLGKLASYKLDCWNEEDIPDKVDALTNQYKTLLRVVNDKNPYVWDALIDEGAGEPTMPATYSPGSPEEAQMVLCHCKKAWEESEDAVVSLEADTSAFVRVYKGPSVTASVGDNNGRAAFSVERRRGTGTAFPADLTPRTIRPAPCVTDLFAAVPLAGGASARYVAGYQPGDTPELHVLVYADGACSNNGQQSPRAGWAVAYGPGMVVSGRLEEKGPFGDASIATSNRAELRAAIAALRMANWKGDGFDRIVIATDSSYVVDGATAWVKGWVHSGWKTRKGEAVKNRDLWEMLLGEVERWREHGFGVGFWKVPREQNTEADAAAKKAAETGTPEPEFRDVMIEGSETTAAGGQPLPHILALCFEYEDLFYTVHDRLVQQLSAKSRLQRATTPAAALDMLNQSPAPSVILVADAAMTRHNKICERVIDLLREGATVVLAGCFSSMVSQGQFDRFFARVGLPWRRGSYHRVTIRLRRRAVGDRLAGRLPAAYSQKAVFVKKVDKAAVWYAEKETGTEAAVVFAKVGKGMLGYVGDVNGEEGSEAVVLAMCGLLN